MKKLISLVLSILLMCGILFADGKTPATLRVAALVGPSGIGMSYLFTNTPDVGQGTVISFETAGSVDILLPKMLNREIDIGILPPNVAAKIYNVNAGSIITGAIVGNGMLSLITRDTSIKTLSDLAGKTVSVAGQGSTPEYVIRTLMAKSGIPSDSVTLDFSVPTAEIAAALISNKIAYALVPEPFATVAVMNGATGDKPVIRAIQLRDVWNANGFGSDFPMTLCVVRKEYAEKYPETVRKFLEAYKKSILWTNANPVEAGKLVEANNLGLKAPIAAKAIPSCNFVYIPAAEGRDSIEKLLSAFLAYAPEAIGGKLPDGTFYFK